MPNLWTKAMQSIHEKLSGPRTNDVEIKKKYDEAVAMDKALIKLKHIISNFSKCFEEIMNYNREISESIFVLYDNNEEYKEFAYVLNKVHVDNNKLFKQVSGDIFDLNEKTKDWPIYFSKIKDLFEEKELSRKVYDHYEIKMEALLSEKECKVKKGVNIGDGMNKQLERNEEKFLKAKENYLEKCITAYDTFETLLNDRFNLMNGPLLNLFFIELQIYENFSSKYTTYKDLENKLSTMRNNFAQKDRKLKYDPTIFLKNPYIESKFNKKSPNEETTHNNQNMNKKIDIKFIKEECKSQNEQNLNKMTPTKVEILSNSHNFGFNFSNMEKHEEFDKMPNQFSNFKAGSVKEQKIDDFFNFNFSELNLAGKNDNNNNKNNHEQIINPNDFFNSNTKNIIENNNIEPISRHSSSSSCSVEKEDPTYIATDLFSSSNVNIREKELNSTRSERVFFEDATDGIREGIFCKTQKNPFKKTNAVNNDFPIIDIPVEIDKNQIDNCLMRESELEKKSKFSYPSLTSVLGQLGYYNNSQSYKNKENIPFNNRYNEKHKIENLKIEEPIAKKKMEDLDELFNTKATEFGFPNVSPDNNPNNNKVLDPFAGFL